MAATLTARFFRRPSNPGVVVVRRDADGYRWDFTNTVFSATPALDYLAPTEDSTFPGMYLFQIANQEWDGLYQVFHYVSSAKAGTPLVLSINLTNGAQDSLYGDLAESVRLELDANSTQLAAIVEDTGTTLPASLTAIETDTQDLQTQVGTAGAGLTAVPWNAAWDAEVQSECADALTAYDPPTATELTSAFTEIKGATWSASTDTLEAIRDKETDIETDTQDLQTQVGTDGAGLTALPWNSAWDAEVNAEMVDVLRTDTLPDDYAAHEEQPTIAEAILAIHQFLFEREVSGTSVTVQKPDGTTTAMTLTLDDGTNPTTVHRSA